ncbi:MAG: ATP-binding protein [Spirochaetaceae bacterium]|nr:ATP-binding protein [Spirochaetaceae bacterium]
MSSQTILIFSSQITLILLLVIFYLITLLKKIQKRSTKLTSDYHRTLKGIKEGRFQADVIEGIIQNYDLSEDCYYLLGYQQPRQRIPQDFFDKYLVPDYRLFFEQNIWRAIHKKESFDFRAPCKKQIGKELWIRLRGGVFEEGDRLKILGTLSDVDLEQKLHLKQEKDAASFRLIHRAIRIIRWEYRAKENIFYLTQDNENINSFKSEELWNIFPEQDRKRVKNTFEQAFKNGSDLELITQMSMNINEQPNNDWMRIHGYPQENNPNNYLGMAEVITPLIKMKAELQMQHSLFKGIIDNIPLAIFVKEIVGEELRYILWNRAVEKLNDYVNIQQDVGKTDIEIYPKEMADRFILNDKEVIKFGQLKDFGIGQSSNKEKRIVHFYKFPLRDINNSIKYIIGVAEDITEKKKLEEELLQVQKLDAIGKLAGGIAHDFNNMMAGILGTTELLLSDEKDPKKRRYLENTLSLTHKAAELTEQLLTFSRKGVVMMKSLDIHRCIEESLEILHRTINKNIEITTYLKASHSMVYGNENMLMNIFLNLGINARDSMPRGGRLLITSLNKVLDDKERETLKLEKVQKHWICIEFCDEGLGMDETMKEKIFEPFFTTKELGRGTGLGLSTVYGSTLKHSGSILVETSSGQGSCFTLYFPIFDESQNSSRSEYS